ncbi:MAG: ATP-binding protein [Candidatus Methanoperedens sp.]|nr:ATP-binding protein [Candidatus Methanoperedens sp.]
MNESKAESEVVFRRMAKVCNAIVLILGTLTMIGWLMDIHILASFGTGYIPIAPGAALAFILLGGAWYLYARAPSWRFVRICVLILTLFVSLMALLNLIQFLTGADVGIEEYLVREILGLDPGAYGAGPTSPIAAASFLLICAAMVLLLFTPGRRAAGLSAILASAVTSVGLVVLLGYLYGTPQLYGGGYRYVALPAGVMFVFLGTDLIAAAGPEHFPLRLLVGPSIRALLMRSFLLVIFVVILIDGTFNSLFLQLGLTEALRAALSALIAVAIASIVISQISRTVGGAMDRAEAERKRAEEELARRAEELARSNAELEQFVYIASHDLQEPLRMISIFTQLLERRYKGRLDKDADEFITYIVDGAKHMQQMIEDLLAYSRIGTRGKPFEPTDFKAVLEQAVANLKPAIEENKAQVTHDPLPTAMADASQMVELFQHLINNAIKFRKEEPPRIHVSAKREGEDWVFSVQDNGTGISPEFMKRLFKIFQREHAARYPGTGVGLAICRRIVERQGGRIWAESVQGAGTTFYFTIPVRGQER